MKKIIVGLSGASGAILAERFVRVLLQGGHQVHAIVSSSAALVFEEELGVVLGNDQAKICQNFHAYFGGHENLLVASADDFADRVSSGSAKIDAMVVIPCSMSTVGAIAHGVTMNLIHRAAGVSIKEKRPLLLVPRESPLSPIHLKNLLYLSEIGVHIVPATTAFYHKPKTVEEMVDFTLGRVLDLLKIEHSLFKRWKQAEEWDGVYQGI